LRKSSGIIHLTLPLFHGSLCVMGISPKWVKSLVNIEVYHSIPQSNGDIKAIQNPCLFLPKHLKSSKQIGARRRSGQTTHVFVIPSIFMGSQRDPLRGSAALKRAAR
jgi:hypothetical protein